MRRATQNMLYNLLPVVFWLLAIGGSFVSLLFIPFTPLFFWGYLVAAVVMIIFRMMGRIQRHTNSIEECFVMGILLGVVSYWLPTVIFLTLPIWFYLIYQNLFNFRSMLATLLGYAAVGIWATVMILLGWISNPWASFFATDYLWGWIPLGSVLLAWLASTIARQILRVR